MKAFDIMTSNLVAAREGTTAREIGTKLLVGNFNGLPVKSIDDQHRLVGVVSRLGILRQNLSEKFVTIGGN
jgi:CBS domain-containing protein